MVKIRAANEADAGRILHIYRPYVEQTAISFESEPPSQTEMAARIQKCLQKFPWIVCEINGEIAGYVYASTHREREAYQWTCECSVYIDEKFKGKGIGKTLYELLFDVLTLQGLVNVYAGITLPNDTSVRLHEKCGFEFFAGYDNIGYKLGKWHKVGWWRRQLHDYNMTPAPPLKFSELDCRSFIEKFDQAARRIESSITG
jgi:L-amino acid N-acyltransferase YncA